MENKPCKKCLCCSHLPDCAAFWEINDMPAPDYGCSGFKWVGFRESLRRLLGVL